MGMSEARPRTFGELKKSGWQPVSVKQEMRRNLIKRIRDGKPMFDGIFGYEESVIPQLENAILSGQDIIFLGERGQAKSRMIRSLTTLHRWVREDARARSADDTGLHDGPGQGDPDDGGRDR